MFAFNLQANNKKPINHSVIQHEHIEVIHQQNHTDTSPLFFIIIAVIIGALTRFILQKSALPFTVALLIIGFGLGALGRINYFDIYEIGSSQIDLSFLDKSIQWAANIDPHLLLYVFLPILIFEAAFAMDVHVFKKTFANATIMAVPGILVAIVLSAAFVVGLNYFNIGLGKWNWTIALLFGAVISATDPVAVVSILKTLGASKKLGTLIEGESLLNDGTAIVIFMVIYLGLTGDGIDGSPIVEFLRVSFGGIAIGLLIGWIIIQWIKKVFNDMFVEITAIIAAAYLTFFIAEHFFSVSGVLALVAFGLIMASYGRTKISPEVQHFLHEFWELAAFIANTLIFLIVGVVIAVRTVFTFNDFIVLGLLYIGIFIIRAIVIALFYPLMKKFGYGITKNEASVLWYGALRGAIGLALALIIAGSESIDTEIRDQFLFLTAGIVTLTLLVNATTIKILVNYLGLTKLSPAKQLSISNTNKYIEQSAQNNIERLKHDRYLKRANWNIVRSYLPEYQLKESSHIKIENNIYEFRRRILEKEKSSYWHQFKDGLLSDRAYNMLTNEINEILDKEGSIPLSKRNDLEQLLNSSSFLAKAQNYPIIGGLAKRLFFERLTINYGCAKGFITAQEDNMKLLESIIRADNDKTIKTYEIIEEEINSNRIEGLTFLRNLGKEYPEIYNAIATKEAARTMLNYEKHTVERLVKKGRVTDDEANKLITQIETKMKQLRDVPPIFELPNAQDLLAEIKWLEDLDHKTFNHISKLFVSKVYDTGKILLKEGELEDGMFIISRGSVKVTINKKLIDFFGPGSTIGEVAALNNTNRSGTVTAEVPTTVLWISTINLKNLIADYPSVGEKIWKVTAIEYTSYLLNQTKAFEDLTQHQLRKKLTFGKLLSFEKEASFELLATQTGALITGKLITENNKIEAPILLLGGKQKVAEGSKIFIVENLT
jgi:NhaP-type Na+/H+ or K+/H+ antiporter/CRP-like cAMP-binding protein